MADTPVDCRVILVPPWIRVLSVLLRNISRSLSDRDCCSAQPASATVAAPPPELSGVVTRRSRSRGLAGQRDRGAAHRQPGRRDLAGRPLSDRFLLGEGGLLDGRRSVAPT